MNEHSPPSGQRRWFLRDRTTAAHAHLDQLVGSFDSSESYRRYLAATARFRLPVEAHIASAAWPAELGAWRPRMLSADILADMRDLDMEASTVDAVSRPSSLGEWIGMLYVLEGSSLGARVLAKRAQAIGFGSTFGARHLSPAADGTEGTWRSFLAVMDGLDTLDMEAAARAAVSTFETATVAFGADRSQ